jgi:hypothetical protein
MEFRQVSEREVTSTAKASPRLLTRVCMDVSELWSGDRVEQGALQRGWWALKSPPMSTRRPVEHAALIEECSNLSSSGVAAG